MPVEPPLICNSDLGQMVARRFQGRIVYVCEECHHDEYGVYYEEGDLR